MTIHKCLVCNKIFARKAHLRSHLYTRKKPCTPPQTGENGNNESFVSNNGQFDDGDHSIVSNNDRSVGNDHVSVSNNDHFKKIIQCNVCKKIFKFRSSLSYHKKHTCAIHRKKLGEFKCGKCLKGYKTNILRNRHVKRCNVTTLNISNINNSTTTQILTNSQNTNITDNSTNNHITNNNINIQNTITLVSHSKENMDWITSAQWCSLFRKQEKGVCGLFKLVNFNPNHPENHNILGIDFDSKFLNIFREHGWKGENSNMVSRKILQRMYRELEKEYNICLANGCIDDYTERCFSRFQRKMDSGNYDVMTDRLIEIDIPLTICNNKKMVEKTMKLIAEQKERKKYLIQLQQQKDILQNKYSA